MRTKVSIIALHRIMHRLLREVAGPEKPLELLDRLKELNDELKVEGIPVRAGVLITRSPSGRSEITFSIRVGRRRIPVELASPSMGFALQGIDPPLNQSRRPDSWRDELAEKLPYGRIVVAPTVASSTGSCLPEPGAPRPWHVLTTWHTRRGWGPMLYELALELATAEGGGLMSDRHEVSPKALKVWTNYDRNRGDVDKLQLDADDRTVEDFGVTKRTPDSEWDDCDQFSAADHMDTEWDQSPLSRVYQKEPNLSNIMRDAGLLWE
jgi:hypothetical protein